MNNPIPQLYTINKQFMQTGFEPNRADQSNNLEMSNLIKKFVRGEPLPTSNKPYSYDQELKIGDKLEPINKPDPSKRVNYDYIDAQNDLKALQAEIQHNKATEASLKLKAQPEAQPTVPTGEPAVVPLPKAEKVTSTL